MSSLSEPFLTLLTEVPNAHREFIWNVKFHPSLSIMASCGSDKKINIWKYEANENFASIKKLACLAQTHSRTIRCINWDTTGNYLAASSMDSTVSIWKMINKENNIDNLKFECLTTLEGHDSEVKCVSWSISGKYLSTCSRDKTVWIWDVEEDDFSCNTVLHGHSQDVKMVKWSPREDVLFSCGFDDSIKVWMYDESQDDWCCVNTLSNHFSTVWCIDFDKKGELLASCSDDLSVIIWRIDFSKPNSYKNITLVKKIENCHLRSIYFCTFFNDKYIFTASGDDTIGIIEVDGENSHLKERVPAHEYDVNCCDVSGKLLASCGDDSKIKLWKINI